MITKGNKYKCIVDTYIDGVLMFKSGNNYVSTEDNHLLGSTMTSINVESILDRFYSAIDISNNVFSNVLREMNETYIAKNTDYGNSFDVSLDNFGVMAGVIRISDKVNRLINITKNKEMKVGNESLRDTLLDLANYAAMTIAWLDRKEGKC